MNNLEKRLRRKKRIRAKIFGTKVRPRLSVFRSNKNIYAQLIDDEKGETLVASSATDLKDERESMNKTQVAGLVGEKLAKKALKKKIERIIFDRNAYKYHGRVKALALGARKGGLNF